MDSADGQSAGTRECPGLPEGRVTRGGLGVEGLADLFGNILEFLLGSILELIGLLKSIEK